MADVKSKQKLIIPDEAGNEGAMIRIDKTLQDMMNEKPSSRWSPEYWHIKYDRLFEILHRNKTIRLSEHRTEIKSGYRSGDVKFSSSGIPYLQVRNIMDTGIDFVDCDLIPANSPARQANKKIIKGDILLNRSGEGSVGRLTIFLGDQEAYVGGHVYRFELKDIDPIYVCAMLKTIFCKEQIHRFESGVSGKTEIDLEEILDIEIPIIENVMPTINKKYKIIDQKHNQAMLLKKTGDNEEYTKAINIASNMLKDLIGKIEGVIMGESKDVI